MKKEAPEIFVGIDIAYDDTDSIFKLAEEVEGYVNLIVIGSINVTFNVPKLTIARAGLSRKWCKMVISPLFGFEGKFELFSLSWTCSQ